MSDHLKKALHLRNAGRKREALKHFQNLARMYPTNARIRFHLAEALDSLGRERRAIPHYHRALRLAPRHPHLYELLLYLSSSYRKTGRPAAASRYLAPAEAMKRDSPLQKQLRRLVDRDLRRIHR
jgi:Flp pilus assembly protein TadD